MFCYTLNNNLLFTGSKMSYTEPADLTDMVREVLKDKKPIAEKSEKSKDKKAKTKAETTPKDETPEDTPEDLKKRSKI